MCNERSEKRLGCVESEVVCDSICRDLKPCDLYHGTQLIFIIIVLPTVSYHHTKNVRHASCMGMKYEPPNKEYLYSQKKIDSQKIQRVFMVKYYDTPTDGNHIVAASIFK
jgi:hypothetical protein